MLIRCVSDIHEEFGPFILPEMDGDKETVLIVAGDVGRGVMAATFLNAMAERFRAIVYVYGNHEFYEGNLCEIPCKISKAIKHQNIFILNNMNVEIDDVVFVGGTLWTDFDNRNPLSMLCAQRGLNDFKYITMFDNETQRIRRIIPDDLYIRFTHTKQSIVDLLTHMVVTDDQRKVVVVTHHGPSYRSIHPMYRSVCLNSAYCSEIIDQMLAIRHIDLWVHGHTHHSFDYYVGKTRVLCNPRGYVGVEVNPNFDSKLTCQLIP